MRVELNVWILFAAAIVPLAFGLLAAWPLWLARAVDEIGSIVGAGVILAFTVGFIAREFGDVMEITRRCVEAEVPCHFRPEPFTRYAVYAGLGLIQIFAVFLVGLGVEERLQNGPRARWRPARKLRGR